MTRASRVPPVIAETNNGAASRAPSSSTSSVTSSRSRPGQRAVAQPDRLQARAPAVHDVAARGDPQVIGLACAGGLEGRRDRGPGGGHRLR
jgi:hypothetical protein